MKTSTFSVKARVRSFRYAWAGVCTFFRREPNAGIHLVATAGAFSAAFYFSITKTEFLALILATTFVWIAEIFNTAIERITDFISPRYHPEAGIIKDLAAAAVLLSAISACVTGAIIFIPKFF